MDNNIEEPGPAPRHQDRNKDDLLENLEYLSRFVYKLNYTDKTSEDYVYYQIIRHLAENGSFTVTKLDRKIMLYKKTKNGQKKIKIERRKLKKILEGTAKGFSGLIPLNYVSPIPEWKNRGGKQEITYYPTEKGIMASIGYHSYRKNINLKKILKYYKIIGKRYQKFVKEFIKLQIQIYLSYHFVQGFSLGFAKENSSEYNGFRNYIIKPFEIKITDKNLERQFRNLLDKFNIYRKIHLILSEERDILDLIWQESSYIRNRSDMRHGFQGWYDLQCLTTLNNNLKQTKYNIKAKENNKKSSGTRIAIVSKPVFLYSLFQKNEIKDSAEAIKNHMRFLGLD